MPASLRAPLLAALLLTSSCAWLSDRAADLADVFSVEVGAGLGLAVDVKATDLLHPGVGYVQARKAGLSGRRAYWLRDRELGLPFSTLLWAGALRDLQLWRLGQLHAGAVDVWQDASVWRRFDLEVGLFAGVFGLRVGLSPGELVDLFAGLVGFDPAGDDEGPPLPEHGPEEPGVWLVGDLHDHCDPPDGGHAPTTPEETHALARANGLDFVGINPHLWVRGRPPGRRPELVELARRVQALDGEPPFVIPGVEVMLRGPARPSGHVLLLFRDPAEAFDFDAPGAGEAEWVMQRLSTLPRARRLWVPAHPLEHEPVRIPFFPDRAGTWSLALEEPAGEVELGGRRYQVLATPWHARLRRDGQGQGRVVRLRLDPREREALPLLGPIGPKPGQLGPSESGPVEPGPVERRRGEEPEARGEALPELLRQAAPAAWRANGPAELDQLELALTRTVERELAGAPPGTCELEVVVDVGREGWVWTRVRRGGGERPAISMGFGAAPLDDGRPLPALHDVPIDGLETLSGLLHLASLAVGRRGEELDLARAFALLERRMLRERRRLVPLAGSDNHRELVFPTLWAFAATRSREGVFDALRQGRVCVGGPDAASFRVRTDRDPVWRAVGAAPPADRWVELRWRGEAELFVDGRSQGHLRGGFRHQVRPGELHLYRIVRGPSWSGWMHVNLPETE